MEPRPETVLSMEVNLSIDTVYFRYDRLDSSLNGTDLDVVEIGTKTEQIFWMLVQLRVLYDEFGNEIFRAQEIFLALIQWLESESNWSSCIQHCWCFLLVTGHIRRGEEKLAAQSASVVTAADLYRAPDTAPASGEIMLKRYCLHLGARSMGAESGRGAARFQGHTRSALGMWDGGGSEADPIEEWQVQQHKGPVQAAGEIHIDERGVYTEEPEMIRVTVRRWRRKRARGADETMPEGKRALLKTVNFARAGIAVGDIQEVNEYGRRQITRVVEGHRRRTTFDHHVPLLHRTDRGMRLGSRLRTRPGCRQVAADTMSLRGLGARKFAPELSWKQKCICLAVGTHCKDLDLAKYFSYLLQAQIATTRCGNVSSESLFSVIQGACIFISSD
ncbi:hypothetical protein DFH09DRAFT_1076724 [Mycena vulgaris]|nr:hypothetical protein DFH09DRAFT_1076724 [Mycena vulgaris]